MLIMKMAIYLSLSVVIDSINEIDMANIATIKFVNICLNSKAESVEISEVIMNFI